MSRMPLMCDAFDFWWRFSDEQDPFFNLYVFKTIEDGSFI